MNILAVHNYYTISGGEDKVFRSEMELLRKNGHKVIEYIRHNGEIKDYTAINKMLLPARIIFNRQVFGAIKRIIKEEQIDLLHVHNTFFVISPAVYYAAKECGVPIVQTIHNFRFFCANALLYRNGTVCQQCISKGCFHAVLNRCYHQSYLQTLIWYFMQKKNKKRGIYGEPTYICLTELDFMIFKKGMGKWVDLRKIVIKPNFVEDQFEKYRELENESSGSSYYLYVGRLSQEKGVERLINNWMNDSRFELRVIGTGPLLEELKNKAQGKNITFYGACTQEVVYTQMRQAIALIFPSIWYETFGMVIIESMMLGIPIISNNIGNGAILVGNVCSDLVIDMKNPHLLREALIYVKNHPELGKLFREEYEKKYTPDVNYKRMVEIYEKAIEEN